MSRASSLGWGEWQGGRFGSGWTLVRAVRWGTEGEPLVEPIGVALQLRVSEGFVWVASLLVDDMAPAAGDPVSGRVVGFGACASLGDAVACAELLDVSGALDSAWRAAWSWALSSRQSGAALSASYLAKRSLHVGNRLDRRR